jgi:mono/diheme cytochrome c family protein
MRALVLTFVTATLVGGVALAATQTVAKKKPATPAAVAARVERGHHLVQVMGCGDCHTPGTFYGSPDMSRLLAGSEMGWKGPWGVHYAANLTPDEDTGIGYWTAAEIAKVLRTGIRPDGTAIGAPMPIDNYKRLTQADAEAIGAFLLSLKPVKHKVPAALKPGDTISGSIAEFPPPSQWDAPRDPATPPADEPLSKDPVVAQGQYLVSVIACNDCHTPGSLYGAPDRTQFLAGSEMGWSGPWGTVYAANLTPDTDTGLGKWSVAEIAKTIRTGNRPDGRQLAPAMPWLDFANLTDMEATAIATYLKSLPAIVHSVPKPVPPGAEVHGPAFAFPPPTTWDAPREASDTPKQ